MQADGGRLMLETSAAPNPKHRWGPRFSLLSLVILVLLIASGSGLWWRWEPWQYVRRDIKFLRDLPLTVPVQRAPLVEEYPHHDDVLDIRLTNLMMARIAVDFELGPEASESRWNQAKTEAVWIHRSQGIHVWRLKHPTTWWGIAWLWEFWATVAFGVALIWSLWRDGRMLREPTKSAGAQ